MSTSASRAIFRGLGERWCAQRVCHRLHADAQTIPGNPFQLGTRLTKTYNFVPEKRKVLRCALAEVPTYDSPAQEPQGHEASVVGPREGIPPGIAFTDRKIETSKSFLLMSSITRQWWAAHLAKFVGLCSHATSQILDFPELRPAVVLQWC
ncbi:unnamed protein product [Cladocopium goreaui]|uniref:Uncharacterized protein n=1 Tax=Cladocopium goreaui TaxID=2562237 RepID=A0A9P1FYW4_9DINO|nr:unnamed protein product [Cladocopium goreaui]